MLEIEYFKKLIAEIKFTDNLRQSDIAERLDVHTNYLSDMLNGRVPVTDNLISKIYELFPYTKKGLSDAELENEQIKSMFAAMKKRVEELEYIVELQKQVIDNNKKD